MIASMSMKAKAILNARYLNTYSRTQMTRTPVTQNPDNSINNRWSFVTKTLVKKPWNKKRVAFTFRFYSSFLGNNDEELMVHCLLYFSFISMSQLYSYSLESYWIGVILDHVDIFKVLWNI